MSYSDVAVQFQCAGVNLVGIASIPATPATRGLLIVVGGPQYRVGSHRQFTLLARAVAAAGFAVLRFDYRGMGDSDGAMRDFEDVDADLAAAVDQLFACVPTLQDVVIWGLCDGASAAMFYAATDCRVSGLVMLNPWVRSEQGLAKSTLKHYYVARLRDPALWKKIATLNFNYAGALTSLLSMVGKAFGRSAPDGATMATAPRTPFQARMRGGLQRFGGRQLFIISGADLTAREFLDVTEGSPEWRALLAMPTTQVRMLDGADHTFSRRAWRDQVAVWTIACLRAE